MSKLSIVLLLTAIIVGGCVPSAIAAETTAERDARMAWWRDAKFGMFIHWGIYAVPAGEWGNDRNQAEWIMLRAKVPFDDYVNFATRFNPVKFDAREWVRVAKDAGMKYLVITAKHHDGFCMFDTKLTDYNIVKATPYRRDPMKELAAACREAGLVFCFYYSIPDWHHPEFPVRYSMHGFHGVNKPDADLKKYVEYLKGQLRELLTNYGPIGILWFDDGGCFERIDNKAEVLGSQEIADLIHQLQPDCLINDRLWAAADYGTPEQRIPGDRQKTAFEVCMTLNRHWGYNKYDKDYKTPKEVVRNLADIAHKGGNYLLNVGPTAEGLIPPESVDVLREVGKWMAINGESIYGTTAGPIESIPAWGRGTAAPGKLYLHVFEWPADGVLEVEGVNVPIARASFLADPAKKPLDFDTAVGLLVVKLPPKALDPINTVIMLNLK
jgi:alpha-L-fucosidase